MIKGDEPVEIAGNRLVWRHIQRENQKMLLDPLGYDAIKDIDEIHLINRRKSDDPYIRATMEKSNFVTRKLDASDYHKDHLYMKSLDKALTHYFVTKTEDPAEHGEDFEAIKIDILNSLFHPQAVYDKRVESPNKK